MTRAPVVLAVLFAAGQALAPRLPAQQVVGATPSTSWQETEQERVLRFEPGVTVTLVMPRTLNTRERIDLVLYALPNGNSTAETMGRAPGDSVGWRYDIQHIAAQTRALRERGYPQAVVAYLEADGKSWPAWRAKHGYAVADARIAAIVDSLRDVLGSGAERPVTLTGHSGGGSFTFGFLQAHRALPEWLERIAFLDSNYNFDGRHSNALVTWLQRHERNTLVVLAYDDREIMLDGKKVVSDSGGTWRATTRMLTSLSKSMAFTRDTLGPFVRDRAPQVELLRHTNPGNRILHTELIGEMNGYMHALLTRRDGYNDTLSVLKAERVYQRFVRPR